MADQGILRHVLDFVPEWRVIDQLPTDSNLAPCGPGSRRIQLAGNASPLERQAKRLAAIRDAPEVTPELTKAERHRLLYALGERTFMDAVAMSRARADDPRRGRGMERPVATSK